MATGPPIFLGGGFGLLSVEVIAELLLGGGVGLPWLGRLDLGDFLAEVSTEDGGGCSLNIDELTGLEAMVGRLPLSFVDEGVGVVGDELLDGLGGGTGFEDEGVGGGGLLGGTRFLGGGKQYRISLVICRQGNVVRCRSSWLSYNWCRS